MKQTEETYELAARFLRVFQTLNRLAQQEIPDAIVSQLSVNQIRALQVIYYQPGITQKELAEKLEITAASVSISVGKMVKDELIEKLPDESDGRLLRLYLGTHGKKLAQEAMHQQTKMIADLLSGLDLSEQQMVVEAIERALQAQQSKIEFIV